MNNKIKKISLSLLIASSAIFPSIGNAQAYQSLVVSCSPNYSGNVPVNVPVVWTAIVYGGDGSYSYAWNGDENLSGSAQSVTKYYSNAGSKTATVTVVSGSQTTSSNCGSMNIVPINYPTLNGACYPEIPNPLTNQSVRWYAQANGGTGSYTYIWQGDDFAGGEGQSITHSYYVPGYRNMTVTITSGNQTITRSCSMNVVAQQNVQYPPYNNYYGGNQVLGYNQTPNISSVYLSNVPQTGKGDTAAMLFISMLMALSFFLSLWLLPKER